MMAVMIYTIHMLVAGEDHREARKERERVQAYERYYESEADIDRQVSVREVLKGIGRYIAVNVGCIATKMVTSGVKPQESLGLMCAPLIFFILMF
jgi:hypothetical protein